MRSIFGMIFLAFSLLSSAASAQVYESEDAEGHPSFSDEPTQGSREVEVESTNVADPVVASPPGTAAGTEEDRGGPVIIVNQQKEPVLNEGRRVILDSDEYERGMDKDPRMDVVPIDDVETDLVDDQGNRLVDPKKDMPNEGIHVIHKKARGVSR